MRNVRLFALLLLVAPGVASAATGRSYVVTDYDRIRIDGPFDVALTTRTAPSARADGPAEASDTIDIRVEGRTLVVRAGSRGWAEVPRRGTAKSLVIRLGVPMLRGATVVGGGRLAVTGPFRAQRIDLQVTGSGSIEAPGLDGDELNATMLGSGAMTLGGRGGRVRLLTSGTGGIDATALRSDALTVRLDGSGTVTATARYTADATSTGLGAVTIYGKPTCRVSSAATGPIRCGAGPAP
ncbi:head GIN domain-containing protein [Sphingomonas sp. PAMC 26617]|uniref:head GIN domain-containing protein n=1 Tax=Sphingomonas sp. PAMC 26617 TaxID=1112216 RepID=UPI000287CDEA|nr:head GIN domain-containing protein [Sphingomonas sp. PAMC 26617]